MTLPTPTLDQTEGVWIGRTSGQEYHYVQEVFSGDTLIERTHRDNCRFLIERGSLQREHTNSLAPYSREGDETKGYCQVPRYNPPYFLPRPLSCSAKSAGIQ